MTIRRALFALPFLFLAASAAEACSSSSSTATGDGGGGSPTGTCATLAACCSKLGTSEAKCVQEAEANNQANCTTTLSGAGTLCSSVTSSSTGSSTGTGGGTSSSSGTGPGGSSTGSGTGSHTGSTSSASGGPTCTNPPAAPLTGFSPPTGLVAGASTSCTMAEATGWGACVETTPTTDAGTQTCDSYVSSPDGANNSCGNCIFSQPIVPGTQVPTTVGLNLTGALYGTLNDQSTLYGAVNFGPTFGACVLGVAGSNATATKCGQDDIAFEYCRFSICLSLCAVPEADLNSSAQPPPQSVQDLITCLQDTASGACASYANAEKTDCAGFDGGSLVGQCASIYDLDEGLVDGGQATATTQAELIGAVCGGSSI